MRRIFCMVVLFMALLGLLTACGGDVSQVEVLDWAPSAIYSDGEIEAAIQAAKAYFAREFGGCTLLQIGYAGDDASEFQQWAEQCGAQEAIVLTSSFAVGPGGGDGSLTPDSTYSNWKWILVRDDAGPWKHADHGY